MTRYILLIVLSGVLIALTLSCVGCGASALAPSPIASQPKPAPSCQSALSPVDQPRGIRITCCTPQVEGVPLCPAS